MSSLCVSVPENQDVGFCVCQVQRKAMCPTTRQRREKKSVRNAIKSTATSNKMTRVHVGLSVFVCTSSKPFGLIIKIQTNNTKQDIRSNSYMDWIQEKLCSLLGGQQKDKDTETGERPDSGPGIKTHITRGRHTSFTLIHTRAEIHRKFAKWSRRSISVEWGGRRRRFKKKRGGKRKKGEEKSFSLNGRGETKE